MSATPVFNPQQDMFNQMGRGAVLFESLPNEAEKLVGTTPPRNCRRHASEV